jgi:hypothetical protein
LLQTFRIDKSSAKLYSGIVKRISPKFPKLLSTKFIIPLIILILLVSLGFGFYFFNQYQKAQSLLNSDQLDTEEVKVLTEKVGSIMEIPQGEAPVVATVSDVSKLSGQPFFAKAKNGDKVLAFVKAQKAILYRPSTNKIVEVTVYKPEEDQTSSSGSAQQLSLNEKIVRVVVFNGTKTAGLAKQRAEQLESKFQNIDVVSTGNASEDYDSTLVVDLSGNNKSISSNLAQELGGEVKGLPSGERKPDNADVLIILGASN